MTRTDWQQLDFYVSMRRADRAALLAGPYSTLTEAMRNVEPQRQIKFSIVDLTPPKPSRT